MVTLLLYRETLVPIIGDRDSYNRWHWCVLSFSTQEIHSNKTTSVSMTCLYSLRGVVLTLLLSSPPLWCSGVLLSDDGLAFSLLLLESLSLMMSYCRQNRAITAAGRREMDTHGQRNEDENSVMRRQLSLTDVPPLPPTGHVERPCG